MRSSEKPGPESRTWTSLKPLLARLASIQLEPPVALWSLIASMELRTKFN